MKSFKRNTTTGENMLIMVNMTGLKKTYWIPSIRKDRSNGLWYVDIKFLFVQFTVYNKELGSMFVRAISNDKTWKVYDSHN